ncbi:hypothetical protein [Kushneria phyllosphaerae]|uniref:Uncharacterized protein n=1 Tax=Kushneria phyllosphaerae TaxID=2100822 RepID=A0A2R8CQE9_9GAMM|nr:hypothetical protein [Kushneria phyllosphaerae]SPJ35145.1 hypothetical protein KSP9073_03200 [Kushneria phyllosphaerae]
MTSQSDSRRLKILVLSLSISTAMAATAAQAAPQDQQTIEALRAQLQQMQQRLDRLEQQQAAASQESTQDTGTSQSSQNTSNSTQQSGGGQQVANSEGRTQSGVPSTAEENQSAIEQLQQTKIGGTLELSTHFDDWNEGSRDRAGDMDFGKFILTVDGEVNDIPYSMEYRFYDGYQFLHHGWVGYNASDEDTFQLGLVQSPFGSSEFGYMGWYGNLPYYMGFADNQNAGLKWEHDAGKWTSSLAFFKNSQLGTGNEHYGTNPVPEGDQDNRAVNQLAGRFGYTFGYDTDYSTELAISGRGGQFYNDTTNDSGDNWATALSLNGKYGNWSTLLQATHYEYHAKNPTGVSRDTVQVGSFGGNWLIPATAQIYSASLGYDMDVDWGPFSSVTFFNDYSYVSPDGDYDFAGNGGSIQDPQLNDVGMLLSADPFYVWFDIVTGKNALGFIGPADDQWHTSIQSNFGVTF